jgi:hypothetical protein
VGGAAVKWRCAHLPWHKLVSFEPLGKFCELYMCSCGQLYAVNHDVRVCLRWEAVSSFYQRDASGRLVLS